MLFRYNAEEDKMEMSTVTFRLSSLNTVGLLILKLYRCLGLVHYVEVKGSHEDEVECSNFTLINLVLVIRNKIHERTLTTILMLIQVRLRFCDFFMQ